MIGRGPNRNGVRGHDFARRTSQSDQIKFYLLALTFPRRLIRMGLFLLDYGAGNVQSLANTLERLGHSFQWIKSPSDFDDATVSLQLAT